jgi:hypothetical protein
LTLGFLTVLHESNGYLGGYLVTNQWGRPLEFRLSTAVQPNRIQQILYGGTLRPYICADLIGKTLFEKTGTAAQVLVTDTEAALDLRQRLEIPVAWLAPDRTEQNPTPPAAVSPDAILVCSARSGRGALYCHPRFPGDAAPLRETFDRLQGVLDLAEPFLRIREAMGEARKMGVTNRG